MCFFDWRDYCSCHRHHCLCSAVWRSSKVLSQLRPHRGRRLVPIFDPLQILRKFRHRSHLFCHCAGNIAVPVICGADAMPGNCIPDCWDFPPSTRRQGLLDVLLSCDGTNTGRFDQWICSSESSHCDCPWNCCRAGASKQTISYETHLRTVKQIPICSPKQNGDLFYFLIVVQPPKSVMPALTREMDSSFPSKAQISVAPPGVEALPDTATRRGHRIMEFLKPSFAASSTKAA